MTKRVERHNAEPARRGQGRYRLRLFTLLALGLAGAALTAFQSTADSIALKPQVDRRPVVSAPVSTEGYVRAVSLDPADYVAKERDAGKLAEDLVDRFAENGINTIYVNAYNVDYGAYYQTDYAYNELAEYGAGDLVDKLIEAGHARGMRVFAAVYDHQHKGAWEANPAWRAKDAAGRDYSPDGSDVQYYLSIAHPEARKWWLGFLRDLLVRHPDLDGIELREPIVNWWGKEADYNPAFTASFRAKHPKAPLGGKQWLSFRAAELTRFLDSETALVHSLGRDVHVSTVAYSHPDGTLLTNEEEANATGFDVQALLAGRNQPEAVKIEFIWQQWAAVYGRVAFNPRWTREALKAYLARTGANERLIAHIELTDFGRTGMTVDEFYQTLLYAQVPGMVGVDFYSAALADVKDAWPAVRSAYLGESLDRAVKRDQRALILYDSPKEQPSLARLQSIYLANLLGRFPVKWDLVPVEHYQPKDVEAYDYVFYQGSVYGNLPAQLGKDLAGYDGKMVWVGQNLFQLERFDGRKLPFAQDGDAVAMKGYLDYKSRHLPAEGEVLPTRFEAEAGGKVLAWMSAGDGYRPYVLKSRDFWYVAGSPFSFLADGQNGRYLAFSDLLNDVFSFQGQAPRAFLRIESVTPKTDPAKLKGAVEVFADRGVPFAVSVVPFHVDPDKREVLALSDQPRLVEVLRFAEKNGGVIVVNGETHQTDGESGRDFEFWNPKTQTGRADDSEALVRGKAESALEELWQAGLHPLAFQTPYYAATSFDYSVLGDYFSTFVERRLYGVWSGDAYVQTFPYLIERDVYGATIVPENLGRLDELVGPNQLLERARQLSVVRGAIAGGFVHPYVSRSQLVTLLDGLKRAGYQPLDFHLLANVVSTRDRVEATGAGQAKLLVPTGKVLAQDILTREGDKSERALLGGGRQSLGVPRGASLVSLQVVAEAGRSREESGGAVLASVIVSLATGGILILLATYLRLRVGRARV